MPSSETAGERVESPQGQGPGALVVVVVGESTARGNTEELLRAARAALDDARLAEDAVVIAPGADAAAADNLLTTREAAGALGVSVSTARRWADEGRLRTTKTSGGHRRFRVADLRGLVRHSPAPARLRLATAPARTLPASAGALQERRALLATVTSALYAEGSGGWFGHDRAEGELDRWFRALAAACRSGYYDGAAAATTLLAQRAQAGGATALECALFLDRLGAAVARSLARDDAAAAETKDLLRLFVVLRQAALV